MAREDVSRLLEAYDAQLRAHVQDRLPDSVRIERDGPLVRTLGFGNRGFVEYRDLAGVDHDAVCLVASGHRVTPCSVVRLIEGRVTTT